MCEFYNMYYALMGLIIEKKCLVHAISREHCDFRKKSLFRNTLFVG